MNILTRPILEINLSNVLENYKSLATIAKNAIAAAVVKDDSYGLGADVIAPILYNKANCRYFFVAHAIEGERISSLVPEAKIYVLQGIGADTIDVFKKIKNLIPVISSPEMLEYWKQNNIDNVRPAIQIETGLNRLGFRQEELKCLSKEDTQIFGLVMSHLACADEKDHFMNHYQVENFVMLKDKYIPDIKASLSASDGVFLDKDFYQDMVRLGAGMYGINTAPYRPNKMANVVTVKAPILQIANLPKGDFVGYSATYRASSDRKIAIVSIGYGDGLPRSLSNTGKVFFKTQNKISEARIIGRVSMDNIICDVTNIEGLKCGDMAYLAADFYTLDDVAKDAGTISYELMSRIGKNTRFIRNYINT